MGLNSLSVAIALPMLFTPGAPLCNQGSAEQALEWSIQMSKELTQFDSIRVYSSITSTTSTKFRFEPSAKSNVVELILEARGKPTRKETLNCSQPPAGLLDMRRTKPDATRNAILEAFRVDLRSVFGELSAGKYSIQLRYPSSSFKVRGLEGYEGKDLLSPITEFEVFETSIEEAERAAAPSNEVRFKIDKTVKGKPATATLTNKTKAAIRFHAYMHYGKPGKPGFVEPLSTIMTTQSWHPKRGWSARPIGYCGTGLGTYVLEPSESVKVMLNALYSGDGIYRYQISYTSGDGKTNGAALSKPFVVRNHRKR